MLLSFLFRLGKWVQESHQVASKRRIQRRRPCSAGSDHRREAGFCSAMAGFDWAMTCTSSCVSLAVGHVRPASQERKGSKAILPRVHSNRTAPISPPIWQHSHLSLICSHGKLISSSLPVFHCATGDFGSHGVKRAPLVVLRQQKQ